MNNPSAWDKSEILVHISAPSGAVDDARYRAQVEAILNFQSHSRETDPPPPSPPPGPSVQAQAQTDSLESPVSVIPDSQPQHEIIADSVGTGSGSASPSLQLVAPLCSPSPSSSPSSSPASKRPRLSSPSSGEHSQHDAPHPSRKNDTPASLPSPAPGPEETSETEPNHLSSKSSTVVSDLPLQINPPPPPISSSPFTTHITPTLHMLTNRLKSSRTYSPTTQTRDLDALERGYWYLRINLLPSSPPSPPSFTPPTVANPNSNPDPRTWDISLFERFWAFLSSFIGKEGRAGWGVWCILESEHSAPAPAPTRAEAVDAAELCYAQHLGLKVYTWGEIACHIYLLLFLASERRIRGMGAQWRDGRDEVVVQMP
ncbi:hypothetical protein BJX61DRAFT_537949 [Aspergillus egyptiacus]|nr:hypothetical protein BJX61DRAFT_537949 [Aspergillus egyptiacus]